RTLLSQGDQAKLKQGGIAMQGLTASEYLLFDPGHLENASPKESCHLLTQVAEQNEDNAKAMLTRWQESDFLVEWHDAALGNDTFASTTQATGYLLAGLAEQLEAIAKNKIYKPFRLNDDKAKPNGYLAENWRSSQSLTNLATNFAQIRDYYLGLPEMGTNTEPLINGPDQLLRHLGFAGEANQIVTQLNQSQSTLDTLVTMGSAAYLSEEGKAQARKLHDEIKQLERALKKPLPHFKLTQRFNSADGD
ncbi:imelysin family protein, partial [Oceanospirillum sp. HFRX-1_2]